jgi:hypothetical protein
MTPSIASSGEATPALAPVSVVSLIRDPPSTGSE